MEKYRAIPGGYMRIGEMAQKAGVTVRTLSYYDKEGLLTPSAESDGGYRLYTDKDLAKLMQILMMKQLGFTLSEIKKRVTTMDTTTEVIDVLTEHESYISAKIDQLTQSLNALKTLKNEIAQVDSVDFKKFANILAHLQMKNERYWLIKYIDSDIFDILMTFNKTHDEENTARVIEVTNGFIEDAARLHDEGVCPKSKQGQDLTKRFWEWLMELTDGDVSMVQKIALQSTKSITDEKHDEVMNKFRLFISSSMTFYISKHRELDTNDFIAEAAELHDDGISPESEQGQDFAERFWDWVMKLTGGDMAMMQTMNEQFEKSLSDDDEDAKKSLLFIKASLEIYLNKKEAKNNG